MPSRKRNKGKERKAKKAEKDKLQEDELRASWELWVHGPCREGEERCNHGLQFSVLPAFHAVTKFMNTFMEGLNSGDLAIHSIIKITVEKHPDVWTDAGHRQMVSDILLTMGTNMILNHTTAWNIGLATLMLDCYDGKSDCKYATQCAVVKGRSGIINCGVRDVLKFYSKRISCSCLNETYKHARKTIPKMGKCWQCEQVKERSYMMTCGRCKVPSYCSRECQVANVPVHKRECGVFAHIRKSQSEASVS